VQVQLFASYTETFGTGIGFADPAGAFSAFSIDFGLEEGPWWPIGQYASFGARVTTGALAGSQGNFTLTLGSDDAAYLFIDQQLVLARPGPSGYATSELTVALAPGYHQLEIQFYNSYCCGSALTLAPGGLEYVAAVPEPGSLPLWLAGAGLTGWALRRRLPPA
jgi:hypothetical protein